MSDRVTPPHQDFYEEGIDLFNQGRFFECHEAWEEIWKRSDGELKLFYQGLIQAAVAILHAQRGNLEGARSLYDKASAKLDKISPSTWASQSAICASSCANSSKSHAAQTVARSPPRRDCGGS